MCPYKYYDILRDSANPFNTRLKMAKSAFAIGITQTAKDFDTTRDTVRKWKRLYEKLGTAGLHNKSKAPKRIPHKTPAAIEATILKHRNRLPSWGPIRLKDDFDLPVSTGAIYRILKQNGKIQKYRRKHVIKQDLRLIKMKMKTFQRIQVDVKDLCDIPNYYRLMRLYGLPRYQYTARDVKSGMLYIAFARRNECVNAANFLTLLAEHLKTHGIDLSKVTVQTDNGAEFIGNWKQRTDSLFTKVAKAFGIQHDRIPPRRCTYNSDVESSHWRIEKDFYDLEKPTSDRSLSIKAFTYLLYFNLLRRNKVKFNKTSLQIARDDFPGINVTIVAFNPVILDNLELPYLKYLNPVLPVDHLPELPKNSYSLKEDNKDLKRGNPSIDPKTASDALSGCGIMPRTLRFLLQMPAILAIEPLGFSP